jgi:transcriptional regulator with XRE-family HTH domain
MMQDGQEHTRIRPNDILRSERQRRGWSREYVAECIGVADPKTIGRWERGVAFPSAYFLQKLCTLFERLPHELGLLHEAVLQPISCSPVVQTWSPPQRESATYPTPIFDPAIPPPLSETDGLVARDNIVQQLKQRLCSGKGHTLTALYGLPGVGKTAIASEMVHDKDIQRRFRDGILWIAGAPAGSDAAKVMAHHLARWGDLLGLTEAEITRLTSTEAWIQAIRSAIGTRHLLIVIDDVWTSEDACALTIGGPNCSYLLTTRLPPVALHFANHNALHIQEWSEEESLQLLARFAPTVVTQHVEVVRTLVRAVGGLPLGITLIGKYCQAHAYSGQQRRLRAALERLQCTEERLRLSMRRTTLERGGSEIGQARISLEMVIAASFTRLDEQVQYTLCQLSVFPARPNSFSEEAALVVCGTSVEALDALVDAGLLEVASPGRYTLHATIADYGSLQRDQYLARRRLLAYFVRYVDMYRMDTYALALEQQNIQAVLNIAFERGNEASTLAGIIGFASFLQAHGNEEQATWYLQQAERVARRASQRIDWSSMVADQKQHTQLLQQYAAIGLIQAGQYEGQLPVSAIPQEIQHRLLTGPPLLSHPL